MKAKLLILLLFAFVLVWTNPALAQRSSWGIPDEEEQKVEVKIDKSKVSPELRRIMDVAEKALAQISDLEQRMQTLDGNQVAELQKQAEQIKKDAEIEILKIRLEIAQQRNDTKNIQEIEKAIGLLENPPPVLEDQESKALREAWERENREKDNR